MPKHAIFLFDEQIQDIIKNATEAGYALGCEHSAALMEYMDGLEYDYASDIRNMCIAKLGVT